MRPRVAGKELTMSADISVMTIEKLGEVRS